MNLREQNLFAKSQIGDQQMWDAHGTRFINMAYREIARQLIIPRLNSGAPVDLIPVSGETQQFYLPYDHSKVISFVDQTGRSLDPILSQDVKQFNEYNSLGTFVQFFEHNGVNQSPLAESGATPITIGIPNRSKTVTASAAVFTAAMEGEWLLPLARNTTAGAGNPEDYGYLIDTFNSTTSLTLSLHFRGVLSDGGTTGDLTTSYFEVRPKNTPIVFIWGDPGASSTISITYQRVPSKLANDEDVPEEPRLAEAIVHKAIEMAGIAYRQGFMVQTAKGRFMEAMAGFQTVKDFDKELIHNFLTANPNARSYSMISGQHLSGSMGGMDFSGGRVNY